jgi:hypothetical protein
MTWANPNASKRSGGLGEFLAEFFEERSCREVAREGEGGAAGGVLDDAGATEDLVAQGGGALEDVEASPLEGLLPSGGARVDLERSNEVVGEGGEDLPGAVGGIGPGGDGVEGEAVLVLPVRP